MKKKSFLLIASLALVSTLGLSTLASCGETSSVAPSTSAPDTPTSEAPTTEEKIAREGAKNAKNRPRAEKTLRQKRHPERRQFPKDPAIYDIFNCPAGTP